MKHWRRFVKNIGWAKKNFGRKINVVKSDKCKGISQLLVGTCPGFPPKCLRLCKLPMKRLIIVMCARCLIKCSVKYSVRKQKIADDFCKIRPFQVYIVYYIVGPLYFTMSWAFKIFLRSV